MPKQREISGTFIREHKVFINGQGTDFEVRVIIGEIETVDGEKLTIKGEASENAFRAGLVYRFYGYTKNYHNKRTQRTEEQFNFDAWVVEAPATCEAVVAYLRQCKGVGHATAYAMFETWGEKAVDKLIYSPEEVVKEIPRLKIKQALEASEQLKRFEGVRRAKIDLLGLLHGRGLPRKMIDKIVDEYGSSASEMIRQNPYLLMDFKGCGFLKADKIYLELGHPPGAMRRQSLCCWYAILTGGYGDTWVHQNVARDALNKNIGGAEPDFDAAIKRAIADELLARRSDTMNSTWLAVAGQAAAEDRVARYLTEAREELEDRGGETLWPSVDSIEDLSDHQRSELANTTTGLISVLAGSPGTGKTYCSAALIRSVIAQFGQSKVAVCAPTGKAAVRVTEAMHNNGINMKALTIHSLLKVEASGGDGFSFSFGRNFPLPYQFVIIDESSMIDTGLMSSLLAARGKGTHFLFVGDTNQLAPVGHGAPLRDMIAAGIPTGTLTEIRRNSGRIVKACAEIRDKHNFQASQKIDPTIGENLYIIERETPEEQIEQLKSIMGQFLNAPDRKHDPIWDIQIIVAVNKRSPLGRKPLNLKLQDLLNPDGQGAPGSPFRVGDKIINTKNGWLPQPPDAPYNPEANDDGKLYVANGEQAEVLQVESNKTICRLQNPDRIVLIPRGTQDDANEQEPDSGSAPVREDEEEKQSTGTGCNWELGYAISGHKSQGSEWQIVIVMVDENGAAKMVCTRNWLYTALSRGKTLVLLIGKKEVAESFCHRDGLRRKTFLVERLKELGVGGQQQPEQQPVRIERTEAQINNNDADLFQQLGELLQGVC